MLYQNPEYSPARRAADLLPRLTLREKTGQLNQRLFGFACYTKEDGPLALTQEFIQEVERFGGLGCLYGLYRADPWSRRDFSTGLAGVEMKQAYNLAQRCVIEHSRFGIPMLTSSECPHGHQALDGYLLPVNLAAGAAWNPDLLEKAYQVCGEQLRELGVDFALISMLDVLRDPRWGRSEECYSEEPCLAAAMARAAVEGCRRPGAGVVAKHFCAQGETTGGVNASAARIGPRELREIHLPPMRAASLAGVDGVMAAYNEIDGVFCHANRDLLTTLLREELGFRGLIMADGLAIDRLDEISGSPEASAALALGAGVQLSLWDSAFSTLEKAVELGLCSEEDIDRAVLAVLELKFRRGLFEHPYLEEIPPKRFTYAAHPESLELARQSPVLLKNHGILPLCEPGRVALIGPNGNSLYNQLGDYTPPQRPGEGITLLQGLEEALGRQIPFAQGCTIRGTDCGGFAQAVELARDSDVIILALGGSSSRFSGAEFQDNGAAAAQGPLEMDCGEGVDAMELRLPGVQQELAEEIFRLGKPIITVIIAGRPYAVPQIAEQSQALLWAFYPGPMGGRAIGELLTGQLSPSGRLPVSLPRSTGGLPCYGNHKASYTPGEAPLYPFGFGLSYTEFTLSEPQMPSSISKTALLAGEKVSLRFRVTNTGQREGHAVPQLFLRWRRCPVVPRVKELKAFDKLLLAPGESRGCTFQLGKEELALWNPEMRFSPEPGQAELWLEEGGTRWGGGTLTVTAD